MTQIQSEALQRPGDSNEVSSLAERFLDAAWNRGDYAALDELAGDEFSVYYPLLPEPLSGTASFKELLTDVRAGLPDAHFALTHVATQGDTSVYRWEATGTHNGVLLGIPPTGRFVRWTGISVLTVMDGRVVREQGEEDGLGLLRQLGVVAV